MRTKRINLLVNDQEFNQLVENSDGNISEYIRLKCCHDPYQLIDTVHNLHKVIGIVKENQKILDEILKTLK